MGIKHNLTESNLDTEENMDGKRILTTILCFALVLPMVGCGKDYSQYAQAVKEQNITRQLRMETERREREYEQRKHEEKMAKLTGDLVMAAGKTENPNDDMMVPLMVMMMEDKWAMAQASVAANEPKEQLAVIRPPDTIGDTIQKSTGAILGLGGIWLGIKQSDNLASVATAGIANAGTNTNVSGYNNSAYTDGSTSNYDSYNNANGSGQNGNSTDNSYNTGVEPTTVTE